MRNLIDANKFKARMPILVAALTAAVVVGCGGGGSTTTPPPPSPVSTSIYIVAANSPFIGVTMHVECANGLSGSGSIGDTTNPGVGVVTVTDPTNTCTAPLKVTATGAGKMRPIGAKSDGSEDLVYNPAVNLPISAIWMPPTAGALPTAANPISVNPITSLVAYHVAPAGTTAAQLTAITPATVNASKTAVAAATGLANADIDKDYRTTAVAVAATRIVDVAALAAANSSSTGTTPAGLGSKTLGQYMVEKLSTAANTSTALTTAGGIANVFVADNGLNVVVDLAVSANSVIDTDATRVGNLITQAASNAGSTPADVSAMLTQIASDSTLTANATTHIQTQLTWGSLATPATPPATVCKVAIGNAVGYVTGATACSTTYLNDDSKTSSVTTVSTPSGVIPYTFNSLATCTGLGVPPGAGALTLVPCKM